MLFLGSSWSWVTCRIWVNNIQYYTRDKKNLHKNEKILYPLPVANSPHPDTVTVSFTMPREMVAALDRRAKMELTNKSDIIRRALLAYLPSSEAAAIRASVYKENQTSRAKSAKRAG